MKAEIIPQSIINEVEEYKKIMKEYPNSQIVRVSSRNSGATLIERLLFETEDIEHEEIKTITDGK